MSGTRSILFLRGASGSHRYLRPRDYKISYWFGTVGYNTWVLLGGEKFEARKERGVTIVTVYAPRIPVLQTLALNLLSLVRLSCIRFDVIICSPLLVPAALILKFLRRARVVVLDIRSIPVETRGLWGTIVEGGWALCVRGHFADGVTVISQGTLDCMRERYRMRDDIPAGIWASAVDRNLFHSNVRPEQIRKRYDVGDRTTLIYHGTMSQSRGLDNLIHALHALATEGLADLRVILLGAGEAVPVLRQMVLELGLERQFIFQEPVPAEEVPGFIAAADAGIIPLPDILWWRISSPLKLFEYLAMGKPVIATDIPAHRGISDAVLLVPDASPTSLAAGIRRLVSLSEAQMQGLRRVACDSATENTWEERGQALEEFLKGIVGPPWEP